MKGGEGVLAVLAHYGREGLAGCRSFTIGGRPGRILIIESEGALLRQNATLHKGRRPNPYFMQWLSSHRPFEGLCLQVEIYLKSEVNDTDGIFQEIRRFIANCSDSPSAGLFTVCRVAGK